MKRKIYETRIKRAYETEVNEVRMCFTRIGYGFSLNINLLYISLYFSSLL